MSKIRFSIHAVKNSLNKPELQFEIKGLSTEEKKIIEHAFNLISPNNRYIAKGEDYANPGTKFFESSFNNGDEARMFFGAVQELGIKFTSAMEIRKNIQEENKKLIDMDGIRK